MLERLRSLLYLFSLTALVLIAILFFWQQKIHPEIEVASHSFVFFSSKWSIILKLIVGVALTIGINAIGSEIVKTSRLCEGERSIASIYGVLMLSFFPELLLNVEQLIAVFLSILALNIILKIYNQPSVLLLIFWASFLFGLSTLLWWPSVFILLTTFIGIGIFRPFDFRNYMMVVIGYVLPFFYWFSLCYLLEFNTQFDELKIGSALKGVSNGFGFSLANLLILMLLSVLSLLIGFSRRQKYVVRQWNQLIIIYFFLFLSLLASLMDVNSIPLALVAILGIFFLFLYERIKRTFWMEVLLILYLGTAFWVNFAALL